jgi:hypothetical protein
MIKIMPRNLTILISTLGILLLQTGCSEMQTKSDFPDKTITKEQVDQSRKEAAKCIKDNSVKMDDGISPADVVGAQITSVCDEKIMRSAYLSCSINETNLSMIRWCLEGFERGKANIATNIVLKTRAENRQK